MYDVHYALSELRSISVRASSALGYILHVPPCSLVILKKKLFVFKQQLRCLLVISGYASNASFVMLSIIVPCSS